MNRIVALRRLAESGTVWDVLIIGGGATGLGAAVDAASRGYRTVLVEQHDFAKGTSSRSTKLAHGGVRYLRSGEVGLVRGALRERGLMERNAPHLVQRQPFVIPIYRRLDLPVYGLGLKTYEWLSGRLSFGASRILSVEETRRLLPTVQSSGLRGGVLYFDGQFDDARLALALAQTADAQGAAVVNYAKVERLLHQNGHVTGAEISDRETGAQFRVDARVVINATGIFTDDIRRLDDAAVKPMMAVSSGVHITLDRKFLPGDHALMIPQTSDGRVLFAVPWQGHVVLGTTDEPRTVAELEPKALDAEVAFLLAHGSKYLNLPVTPADVRSIFTGLRPLVRHSGTTATKSLSRDHVIEVSPAGLVTITGGKWTSYRKMAEDVVTRAAASGGLEPRPCRTAELPLWGASNATPKRFAQYGEKAAELEQLIVAQPHLAEKLHPRLDAYAVQVIWAARYEMARTVDDILSRRIRALPLDARAAVEAASHVAELLGQELGRDAAWSADQVADFKAIARHYLPLDPSPLSSP